MSTLDELATAGLRCALVLLAVASLQAAVLTASPVTLASGQAEAPQTSSPSGGGGGETTSQVASSAGDMGPLQHGPAAAAGPQQVQQQVGAASASGPAPSSSAPLVLPKINIYASRSEVKKLLGIDTSISYITAGQLNTYPLGFSIPMGYHLSDMIFTWQNLGPTNVNYSISLIISNENAVERPLINITRNGLIPRHEQVFKITLPCSGKLTDEVDVQVLINIVGLVPVAPAAPEPAGYGAPAGADEPDGQGAAAAEPPAGPADYQLAQAVQQQNELLAAAQAAAAAAGSAGQTNSSADQMQADQTDSLAKRAPQPQMRLVAHTLAIKRKKICTMHPVPVQPMARQPEIRPPNQPPPAPLAVQNELSLAGAHLALAQAKWAAAPSPAEQQSPTPSTSGFASAGPPTPLAEPSHQPIWSITERPAAPTAPTATSTPPGGSLSPAKFAGPAQARPQPSSAGAAGHHHGHHPQHHSQPAEPIVVQRQEQLKGQHWTPPALQPAAGGQPPPVDAANPLIELLRQQTNAGQQQPQPQQAGNPLLFILVVMSLIISAALVALLVLGSASAGYGRPGPLDKLAALTNCIWRRTSAGSRAVNKCTKNVAPITIKNGIIGTFNGRAGAAGRTSAGHHLDLAAGLKSNVSSLSGLSTISGLNSKHPLRQTPNPLAGPYCQEQPQQHANYNTGFYHHYQHPPDLLLGGPAAAAPLGGLHQAHLTSPYQITMSNNRMTKLFLANPASSGTYSVDNNYMPIAPATNTSASSGSNGCQAAHSDSGSVYQTIY